MLNIEKAIEIEKEGFYNESNEDVLFEKIKHLCFENIEDYKEQKRKFLFNKWVPEVHKVPIKEYSEVVNKAIHYEKFGIYISYGEGVHAYHGNQPLDYDLCKKLGVEVVELNYNGGTIIGSEKDLSIIMVFPVMMDLQHEFIINNIVDIISKYVPNVTVDRNDILVDGKKVSGSMMRQVMGSRVWAAQISFNEYSDYIKQICVKPPLKEPSYIDNNLLTRDKLEEEIIKWLRKE